jgi:hypothetical protein
LKPGQVRFVHLLELLEIGDEPLGAAGRVTVASQLLDDLELPNDMLPS